MNFLVDSRDSDTEVAAMRIEVERGADESLHEQIASTYREAIHRGEMRPRSRLPAIRKLADNLAVSFNTVKRAYSILHDEGFVRVTRYGAFVRSAEEARNPHRVDVGLAALRRVLLQLSQAGATQDQLRREVDRLMEFEPQREDV